jgi:hypothetical protein
MKGIQVDKATVAKAINFLLIRAFANHNVICKKGKLEHSIVSGEIRPLLVW